VCAFLLTMFQYISENLIMVKPYTCANILTVYQDTCANLLIVYSYKCSNRKIPSKNARRVTKPYVITRMHVESQSHTSSQECTSSHKAIRHHTNARRVTKPYVITIRDTVVINNRIMTLMVCAITLTIMPHIIQGLLESTTHYNKTVYNA
jgi:ribosomal protein L28